MATLPNPFGDARPGNYYDSPGGSAPATISGLFPVVSGQGAVQTLAGSDPWVRRCVVCYEGGTNPVAPNSGRWFRLWNDNTSAFAAAGTQAPGNAGTGSVVVDPPDGCNFGGYVLITDGVAAATAPGVVDGHPAAVINQSGSDYYDGTSDARLRGADSTAGNPVPVFSLRAVVNDALYIGHWNQFRAAQIRIATGQDGSITVTWEYYNGASWVALSGVTDGTSNFATSGGVTVRWTLPTDWAATTVGGLGSFYFVRGRISAVTSTYVTQASVTGVATTALASAQVEDASPPGFTDETANILTGTASTILPATQALNDAFYLGFATTTRAVFLTVSTARGGTWTLTWEYYNGTTWAALSGLTDNTTGFSVVGANSVYWTVPSDWATTTVNGVGGLYYVRARISSFTSSGTAPVLSPASRYGRAAVLNFATTNSVPMSPVAYYVGDDPSSVSPTLVSWGVDAPHGDADPVVTWRFRASGSLSNQSYSFRGTYYDSARRIESKASAVLTTGGIGAGNGSIEFCLGDHADANVDSVRLYILSGSTYGLVGTFPKRATVVVAATTSTTALDADLAPGPQIPDAGQTSRAGTFVSCASGRTRVAVGGARVADRGAPSTRIGFANRVMWSAESKPHYFPSANSVEVTPNDGDRIVAVRELYDQFLIFKQFSIHKLVIDPSPVVVQVSVGIGCRARRTIVRAGNVLLFLGPDGVYSIDGAGQVGKLPVSERISDIFPDLAGGAIGNACAAWWPDRQMYLLAVPGLQALTSNGAAPAAVSGQTGGGVDINDGILAVHVPTGRWAIWEGIYPACMTTMWRTSNTMEPWAGDYFGMAWRVNPARSADGDRVSGSTTTGTVTSSTGTTLADTSATFLVGGVDYRAGYYVWVRTGTGAGQIRRITSATATTLTVQPAWTTNPAAGDSYSIMDIYWHLETGDLVLGSADSDKSVTDVSLTLQRGLNSANSIDMALDPTDIDETTTGFTFASPSVGSGTSPEPIYLPLLSRRTQRVRLAGRVGATADAPEIKALRLGVNTFGRAYA